MHQEYRAVVELGQQIFGAAAEGRDPMALQTRSEARREREPQVAPTKLDPFDHRPLERRQKPAPDRLHFGKLGHLSRIRRLGPSMAVFRLWGQTRASAAFTFSGLNG